MSDRPAGSESEGEEPGRRHESRRGPGKVVQVAGAVLLLVPAVLLFAPGLHHPFLDLDDVYFIVENPGLAELSWESTRFLFLEDARDFRYYPLSYLSFAVERHFLGLDPFVSHLVNLVLHLANVLLVFWLVRSLAGGSAAALTALLFAIHPLQVESVAWVMSRRNVLFFLFFLLSIAAYLGFSKSRGPRAGASLAGSVLLYLLAVVSKPVAVTLPAVLLVLDRYLEPVPGRPLGAFLRRHLPSKLAYVPVVAFIYVMTRVTAQRSPFLSEFGYSGLEWIAITGHNFFFYLVKSVLPIRLGVFYPTPAPGELPGHYAAFALLAGAVVALCLWSWRRKPVLFLGTAYYLVTILPMAISTLFFSDLPLLTADRYFYQSSLGVFLLAGVGVSRAWRAAAVRRPGLRAPLGVAVAAGLTLLFGLSAQQLRSWSSTTALYEQVVRHHPSDEFYYRLAFEYENQGRIPEALEAMEKAERAPHQIFFTRTFYFQLRLALLNARKGDLATAAGFLEAALEAAPNELEPVDPKTALAWAYLADLHRRAGDPERAAAAREKSARAASDPQGYFEDLFLRVAPDLAGAFLERRVAAHPEDGTAWHHLGVWHARSGRGEEAAACRRAAERLGVRPAAEAR